jgi:hypothetical protein
MMSTKVDTFANLPSLPRGGDQDNGYGVGDQVCSLPIIKNGKMLKSHDNTTKKKRKKKEALFRVVLVSVIFFKMTLTHIVYY